MKFLIFLEKWIYFRNKNILFGYKKLLIDLFHNIFCLQKVYHESKKRARTPLFQRDSSKNCCSGAHHIILKGQNPVSSLSSHPTAKPSGTAAQFHSIFRSGNPDNPTSIASHITVSSYTAALSQCHFRRIIQSIPHTLQHQEISTFRSVTHALVVSQQTHAVMFRLLLFYTESCKIPRGFLQLFPISRCLFTPHFI